MNTAKDEEVRTTILNAARRLFQRWGLNKTTMEDIAREAGKAKSSLYYYYKNKEEIFDTVVTIEISALLTRAKSSVQEITSAKERLKKYVGASITEMRNTALLYDIVRSELKGNPHFIESVRKQFEPQELRFIREILILGAQRQEFSFSGDDELDTAAQVVLEIVRALELHLFLGAYDARHVDIAAKFIAYGL